MQSQSLELNNQIALITGASSGIGKALAIELALRGADLILIARNKPRLTELKNHIEGLVSFPIKVSILKADITNASDRQKISRLVHKQPKLDILINNAGITAHGRFEDTKLAVIKKTFDLNFLAAVTLTALLLPQIKKSKGQGRIVYISTVSGLYGIPGRFVYSASKAAAHAWMESMRMELYNDDIQCQIVCPGYTRTELRTSGLGADGRILKEDQHAKAISPESMAKKITQGIFKNKKLILTDFNGRFIYTLRNIFPNFLESMLRKKLKDDY